MSTGDEARLNRRSWLMASTAYETVEPMSSIDPSGPGAPDPQDGVSAGTPPGSEPRLQSVLFERPPPDGRVLVDEPDYFADLNLDRVLAALTAGREQYALEPYFYAPLHDAAAVGYRHEVLRDLEQPELLRSVGTFAHTIGEMREHLAQIEQLHYELERQSWFVEAVALYCDAVRALSDDLGRSELRSRALRGLRRYLAAYLASERFDSLVADTAAVREALARIRYRVRIQGPRVTVSRYDGEPDYSAGVLDTFARFRRDATHSYLVGFRERPGMNHVEAKILDCVAELHPDEFARRSEYCARHADFLDATIARFDREVQFYVGYLELIGRLRAGGLPFCYPRVSTRRRRIAATDTFDLALASKLAADDRAVVANDFELDERERMFVVSGPNNGGKTTFARTFGQLHHLASLGLLVPGRHASLFLPDRIYTHFGREERIETLRGKLEDELVRVRAILEQATSASVIVMNESFNSTTLNDALFVGTAVVRQILARDCLGMYVTFVDEIASLSDQTVSMVAQIVPDNPAERTLKVLREPADGLAYASAIADRYGLTYERLMQRIGP
jgi:hypothetical protein